MAYIHKTLLTYPVSEQEIRAANPNLSFPTVFAHDDYALVFATPQPAHNTVTQYAREIQPAVTTLGTWEQRWEIVPLFTAYTDEAGIAHTAAEQEAAATAADLSAKRNALKYSIATETQQRLDDFAKTRGYDGILSACTYATSTIPRLAAEGQRAVNRRDTTWETLYGLLGEAEAGTRAWPTSFTEVEPLLPMLTW